jgi:hypothetical protein
VEHRNPHSTGAWDRGERSMRYYQCDKYPIEFVVPENIDKHFGSHNHVGNYIISVVLQGTVAVCLEKREVACRMKSMRV